MKITVDCGEAKSQQTALLPQAELHKGATGYVLIIQVQGTVYSFNVATIVDLLLKGETSEQQRKDSESNLESHKDDKDLPNSSGSTS